MQARSNATQLQIFLPQEQLLISASSLTPERNTSRVPPIQKWCEEAQLKGLTPHGAAPLVGRFLGLLKAGFSAQQCEEQLH